LTVRASDFHAVNRTVYFRDQDTVEIAELEYKVLPPSAAKEEWFEPLAILTHEPQMPIVGPRHLPVRLSQSQLDSTELQVLLALNEVHGDTGERIQLLRQPTRLVVKGIVDGDDRKRLIERRLRNIANVDPQILTLQETLSQSSRVSVITGLSMGSMEAAASPLSRYMEKREKSPNAGAILAKQLLDCAVTANRDAKAIAGLTQHFGEDKNLTAESLAVLRQLIERHKTELADSTKQAAQLLKDAGLPSSGSHPGNTARSHDAAALAELAETSYLLSVELVSGTGMSPRPAEQISVELSEALDNLQKAVLQLSTALPQTQMTNVQ